MEPAGKIKTKKVETSFEINCLIKIVLKKTCYSLFLQKTAAIHQPFNAIIDGASQQEDASLAEGNNDARVQRRPNIQAFSS
jgi:hypothetical protein